MKNKVFKFLFPIPSAVITILAFILFCIYIFDEVSGEISDVFGMTLVFYIMFVLPLNLIIYVFKTIKSKIKTSINIIGKREHQDKTYIFHKNNRIQSRENYVDKQISASLTALESYKLEDIKSKKSNFREEVLRDPSILQNIEKNIFEFYSELGIHILVSKTDIHANQIIVRIAPHDGIRIKTILSFKDDLSLRLGVPIEMEVFSKLGFIGIMIPIDYISMTNNIE